MILQEIFLKNKQDLEFQKEQKPYKILEKELKERKIKDVASFLKKSDEKFKIIAELKKASPSKGVIREDFDIQSLATSYELGGASAISILTEKYYFQGSLDYLKQVRAQSKLPLLRKDFIFDEYQILQAHIYGADFILLIAKMLEKEDLKRLFTFAKSLNLEVLFEIHDLKDLEKAIYVNAKIIGINHRNLDDFKINTKLSYELIKDFPKDSIKVAESGLDDKKTLYELDELGIDAFLIGEYFMRQSDTKQALKDFVRK